MTYRGYFSKDEIVTEIKEKFPFVDKPADDQIICSSNDCSCAYIKEHLKGFTKQMLDPWEISYLHSELACLSAAGMRWFLPSLLRSIIHCEDRNDPTVECLIFDLGESQNRMESIRLRYSWLTTSQADCIEALLEYLAEQFDLNIAEAVRVLGYVTSEK